MSFQFIDFIASLRKTGSLQAASDSFQAIHWFTTGASSFSGLSIQDKAQLIDLATSVAFVLKADQSIRGGVDGALCEDMTEQSNLNLMSFVTVLDLNYFDLKCFEAVTGHCYLPNCKFHLSGHLVRLRC